jgi:peptidoglycan/LPS O-acetylase OafA/YrhL
LPLARKQFNARLGSLRGIAASGVAISHGVAVFGLDGGEEFRNVPISDQSASTQIISVITGIFNPGGAVVVFFVLSGFVLSKALQSDRATIVSRTLTFYLRRLLRLGPPLWLSVLICDVVFTGLRYPPPQQRNSRATCHACA